MTAVSLAAEILGSRPLLQRPPRGATTRILQRRPNRSFHGSSVRTDNPPGAAYSSTENGMPASAFPAPLSWASVRGTGPVWDRFTLSPAAAQEEHAAKDGHNEPRPLRDGEDDGIDLSYDAKKYRPLILSRAGAESPLKVAVREKRAKVSAKQAQRRNLVVEYFHQALALGDTSSLFHILAKGRYFIRKEAALLPSTGFSELLRCLDPFVVAKQLDLAYGVSISPGLAEYTPYVWLTDIYGIRPLNVALAQALITLYELRRRAGLHILVSDYYILFRCAGAVSDPQLAKKFWHEMMSNEHEVWRHSGLYGEFTAARFLAEPLYAQWNLTQFRVRPLNMHRRKLDFHPSVVNTLEAIRHKMQRKRKGLFGDKGNWSRSQEHLAKIMCTAQPPARILAMTALSGRDHDERLLSNILIALGRSASLVAARRLLRRYWGICISRDPLTGEATITGGLDFEPSSPMQPTTVLLNAVVESFCCMAEIPLAIKLIDFISRRWNIPIPDKTWFTLLQWTYIMVTKPANTEWRRTGLPGKVLGADAVELVWKVMTSEPYNVEPGFLQYSMLIKTLIGRGQGTRAIGLMREMRALYERQVRTFEEALLAYSAALAQGVEAAEAERRYERARHRKWLMWHHIHMWCWALLQKTRRTARAVLDEDFLFRTVPNLVDEFRPFMRVTVRYRTPTGEVEIEKPYDCVRTFAAGRTYKGPHIQPHLRYRYRLRKGLPIKLRDNDGPFEREEREWGPEWRAWKRQREEEEARKRGVYYKYYGFRETKRQERELERERARERGYECEDEDGQEQEEEEQQYEEDPGRVRDVREFWPGERQYQRLKAHGRRRHHAQVRQVRQGWTPDLARLDGAVAKGWLLQEFT